MDASEREKERLRQLAELYDREDLNEDQYRQEYERLMTDEASNSPVSADTATVAALDPAMVEAQLNRGREEAGALQKSPIAPQRPRDTFSSSLLPNVRPTVAMRRVSRVSPQFVFIPAVFLLGLSLALAIGIVRRPAAPAPERDTPVAAQSTSEVAPRVVASFIVPRFGPDAVEDCTQSCTKWGEQEGRVCERGCKRRGLEMYGRRITLEELNPRAEVDSIVAACLNTAVQPPRAKNKQVWRASLAPFVAGLQDVSSGKGAYYSRELYQELYKAQQDARLPPEELSENDDISKRILAASCLVAQDALTLWAFETVERKDDEFSAAFYAKMRDELSPVKFEEVSRLQDEISTIWGGVTP